MPKKAKELSEVSIRRLTHTVATGEKNSELAGKPYKAVYAFGGFRPIFTVSSSKGL